MAISGFFGRRNLSKVAVDIEFPPEIYASREFPIKITIRNDKGFLPVFLMKARMGEYETVFPFVDKKKEAFKYAEVSFSRRGRYEFKNANICSAFPFNFFVRCKTLDRPFSFVVFPEPRKYEILSPAEKEKNLKGERYSDKAGYEADIISIRKYVYGDPLKYINWKATAKTNELKTKELSVLSQQPVVIDFDKVFIRNTEDKISGITYAILQLFRKNIPVGLKMGARLYKPDVSHGHKIAVLKELALYGYDE